MNKYYEIKEQWTKCYIRQNYFTGGIISTQRVESINACMKGLLNSKSSLQENLKFFKEREFEVDVKIEEEMNIYIDKKSSKTYEKIKIIGYFKLKVSSYILEKIKLQFEQSMNYIPNQIIHNEKW